MATRGVNKCIIVGSLGNDPESRTFPDGSSVTNISVATSESWKDKQSGEQKESVEWHRIVLRDRGAFKLGQIAAQYLKKGSKVYIEGSLKTRSYEKDGQKLYVTEIIASEMQMLDSKQDSGAQNEGYAPQQQQRSPAAPQAPQGNQPYGSGAGSFADFNDSDIPF